MKTYFSRLWRTQVRLYPFLFSTYATIHYFSYDLHKVVGSFLITLLISWLITSIFVLVAGIFLQNIERKYFFAFFLTVVFFSYGQFIDLAALYSWNIPQHDLSLAAAILSLGVLLVLIKRLPIPRALGGFLTAATLAMVVYSGWISGVQAVADLQKLQYAHTPLLNLSESQKNPDIYYLVFDDYGGQSSLTQAFNYDNSSFLNQLRQRGFYIADKSTANYNGSLHSITSTLNLDYLATFTHSTNASTNQGLFYKNLFENNRVTQNLQAIGYTSYHLGSWFEYSRFDHNATYNFYPAHSFLGLPYYSVLFFTETTAIEPWQSQLFPAIHRGFATYQLQEVPKIAAQASDSAKFVFAHILLPHGPNVFTANCQPSDNGFIAQLTCTNTQIISLIDQIKKDSKTPPIIILQSDEGTDQEDESADVENWTDKAIQERFPLLAAYYFPDQDYHSLYPSFTPVNSFRLVFQQYFKANLPLLPDRNYLMPDYTQLKGGQDITTRVQALTN